MIIIVFLGAALLMVSTAPHKNSTRQALENIVIDLNRSIPEDLANKLVPDIIDKHRCSEEDFCKAGNVLAKVHHDFMNEWKIVRKLHAYSKFQNISCDEKETGNELQLRVLIEDLRRCVQKKFSKPKSE